MEYSPVKTFQLSPEEITELTEGKRTYEEITATKEPVSFTGDYSETLDQKTYHLMRKQGMRDIDIARHYGLKLVHVGSKIAQWGFRSNLEVRKHGFDPTKH